MWLEGQATAVLCMRRGGGKRRSFHEQHGFDPIGT